MIELIEAIVPPLNLPTSNTPEDAIAHGERAFIDTTLGGQSIKQCVGQAIQSVDWGDAAIRLHLANGLTLTLALSLHDHEVDVTVQETATATDLGESSIADSVVVRLAAQEFEWERAALLNALIGRRFLRLHLSGSNAANFLYVKDIGILHLSALVDRSSQRPFLFWQPSD